MKDPKTLPAPVRRLLAAAARTVLSATTPLSAAQLRRSEAQLDALVELTCGDDPKLLEETRFAAREQAAEQRAAGNNLQAFLWRQVAEALRQSAQNLSLDRSV